MWCSAADTHLKPVDRVVSDACFLTGGVFECDLAHRRSVAVVRVKRGAVIAHRYTSAPPRCRTSQYSKTFIPFSVSPWNDLSDLVFDGVGLAGFKSRANAFLLA